MELTGWNIPARQFAVESAAGNDHVDITDSKVANSVHVRVERHPCFIKPADLTEPTILEPPISVSSRLATPRAVDHFVLKGRKSQKLTLRVESREIGLPVTAVIRVADAAGKEIGRAEPSGLHNDPELSFTPPADGDYHLTVRDLYAGGGPRFAYLLRVTLPEPDFALTAATDRFAVAAGQSIELPLTVHRLDGFVGEIDLDVDGLPLGVEATVVPGKGPAKMTLKLTAQSYARGAGSFRIIGRAKTGPTSPHFATALLPAPFDGAPAVCADLLWLTVTPPAVQPPAAGKK